MDEQSFEELYYKYYEEAQMAAFLKLGNKEEAEDVVQDVYTSLWARRDRLDIKISLKNYFFGAVNNKVKDIFKARGHHKKYVATQINTQSTRQSPSTKLENEDLLSQAVDQISSEAYREAARLVFMTDAPYEEVAEKLGLSVPVSKTYASRGKKAMKKFLENFRYNCYFFNL
jgi:RNA polymerase sigma-70 factor (ECF subfamily)